MLKSNALLVSFWLLEHGAQSFGVLVDCRVCHSTAKPHSNKWFFLHSCMEWALSSCDTVSTSDLSQCPLSADRASYDIVTFPNGTSIRLPPCKNVTFVCLNIVVLILCQGNDQNPDLPRVRYYSSWVTYAGYHSPNASFESFGANWYRPPSWIPILFYDIPILPAWLRARIIPLILIVRGSVGGFFT